MKILFAGLAIWFGSLLVIGACWYFFREPPPSRQPFVLTTAEPRQASSLNKVPLAIPIAPDAEMPWKIAEAKRRDRLGIIEVAEAVAESVQDVGTAVPDQMAETVPDVSSQPNELLDKSEIIRRVKEATVFVQVDTTDGEQTGSGFLIDRTDSNGIIVTNFHVLEPAKGKVRNITCAFHSGTPDELVLLADVIGQDETQDLAFLKVKSEKLPVSINLEDEASVFETSVVLTAGFPFGEELGSGGKRPLVTITKGSVSSVRRGDDNRITIVQVDGGIHPGNSGGPVLTEQGRLVGVAFAKLRGTNIGFAIPKQALTDTLFGRVTRVNIERNRGDQKRAYQFDLHWVDPNVLLKEIELFVFDAAKPFVKTAAPTGGWLRATQTSTVSHSVKATGDHATFDLPVQADVGALMFQVRCTRKDQTETFTKPLSLPGSGEAFRESYTFGNKLLDHSRNNFQADFVELPSSMDAFAFNQDNGDIACIDTKEGRLILIEAESISSGGQLDSFAERPIENKPVAIAYKRHKNRGFYIVACENKASLKIFDAIDLTPIKEVSVAVRSGTNHLSGSSNPDDPFIYYRHGARYDSAVGAINLREMVDVGEIAQPATDFVVAADGRTAYRLIWSTTSSLDRMKLETDFDSLKPRFKSLHRIKKRILSCVPDETGDHLAIGTHIYTGDLTQQQVTLPFKPFVFLRSRPLVIGIGFNERSARSGAKLQIRAASMNSLKPIDTVIELPIQWEGHSLDSDLLSFGSHMFFDEQRERFLVVTNQLILPVPISVFRDFTEPHMELQQNRIDLLVGVKRSIELLPTDSSVEVTFADLPEGTKVAGNSLTFQTTAEQIGTHQIRATLRYEDVFQTVNIPVHIRRASITTPFEIDGFRVAGSGEFAIIWSNHADASDTISSPPNSAQPSSVVSKLPLRGGVRPQTMAVRGAVSKLAVIGDKIAIFSTADESSLGIYDAQTLQKERQLDSTSPIIDFYVHRNEIWLQGNVNAHVYSATSFQRKRTVVLNSLNEERRRISPRSNSQELSSDMYLDGTLEDGIFRSVANGERQLILQSGEIPVVSAKPMGLADKRFLRKVDPNLIGQQLRDQRQFQSIETVGPQKIPGTNVQGMARISLERLTSQDQEGQSIETFRPEIHFLTTQQPTLGSEPFLVERLPETKSTRAPTIAMQLVDKYVYISCRARLYRLNNKQVLAESLAGSGQSHQNEFYFAPKQSLNVISKPRVALSHQAFGGVGHHEFFLISRLDGIEVNEKNGRVQIDRSKLLARLEPNIQSVARDRKINFSSPASFEQSTIRYRSDFFNCTDRKLQGFPLAVPIHLKAVDQEGHIAELAYLVLLELSLAEMKAAANRP